MNGSLPPQGPQWRNSQVCWGSTKAPDWPGRIRWLGSVYYLNSPLTTPPGGERGQTVFLPFTRQTCMACLKVSNVHFRPRLNTFHRRVKQTGHFIRKANSFSRENASAQRGPRTGPPPNPRSPPTPRGWGPALQPAWEGGSAWSSLQKPFHKYFTHSLVINR